LWCRWLSTFFTSSTLKMKAAGSFKTMIIIYQTYMVSHPRPALIFTAVNTSNLILKIFVSLQAVVPKLW
jgi:hypothetical protein